MKRKIGALLFILIFALTIGNAQNYQYSYILVDSTYAPSAPSEMSVYIDSLKQIFQHEMEQVIGITDVPLQIKTPQSELSNLLTDIVYEVGNNISLQENGVPIDMSLLNFGGIRDHLIAQGNITVGDIYIISPFENTLVFVSLQGTELKKMFEKFTPSENQPYSNAQVLYQGGKIASVTVNGKAIENEQIYRIATLNFIADGGDNILTGLKIDQIYPTGKVFRDVIINFIKERKQISPRLDDRIMIQ